MRPASLASPSLAIPAAVSASPDFMPAIPEAKKEIREFWAVLAALAGDEWKSLEADAAGGN